MKKVFLMSVAVLAMTACTSTDVLDEGALEQTNAIGFQTLVNKGSRTNSVPMTNDNFTKFFVYGSYHAQNQELNKVTVFNGEDVTKQTSGAWTYNTLRYWLKDNIYQFYAYSNGNAAFAEGEGRANFGDGVLNLADVYVDEEHQKDLIFAKSDPIPAKETGNDKVAFDFEHILSKLNVKFVNNYPADYTLEISNVKLANFRNFSKYNGTTQSWDTPVRKPTETSVHELPLYFVAAEGSTTLRQTVTLKNSETVTGTSDFTEWGYVLPFAYQSKNIDILFDLKVTNPLGEEIVAKTIKGQWQPIWLKGTAYAYTVKLTGGETGLQPIEFTVNAWEDEDDGWGAPANGSFIEFNPN